MLKPVKWSNNRQIVLVYECVKSLLGSSCKWLLAVIGTAVGVCENRPLGRAVEGVGLEALACWDRGFESRQRHGCLSFVIVFCQVEVSATGLSFVKWSPVECVVSECDLKTSAMRRPSPTRPLE